MSLCNGFANAVSNSVELTLVLFGQGFGLLFINTLQVLLARGTWNSTILPKPSCIKDSVAALNSSLAISRADLFPCLKERYATTGPWEIKTLSRTICVEGCSMVLSHAELVTSFRNWKKKERNQNNGETGKCSCIAVEICMWKLASDFWFVLVLFCTEIKMECALAPAL